MKIDNGPAHDASNRQWKLLAATLLVVLVTPGPVGAVTNGEERGHLSMESGGGDDPVTETLDGVLKELCQANAAIHDLIPDACPPPVLEEAWNVHFDGYGWTDEARTIVLSPDGSMIYVSGTSRTGSAFTTQDFVTIAYTSDGNEVWVARYDGPDSNREIVRAISISPDGTRLFITGESQTTTDPVAFDWATVAYDAATGTQLWSARYNGPGVSHWDIPVDLAVSPDGSLVYVAGYTRSDPEPADYATVAYEASTGAVRWFARYDGPGHDSDRAFAITAGQDGALVYVTGDSGGTAGLKEAATIAYDATTGTEVWVARYSDPIGHEASGTGIVESPDGTTIFITGSTYGEARDYLAAAYDAVTGAQLWTTRHTWGGTISAAVAIALNPDGSQLFITGRARTAESSRYDYGTVAFDAASGNELWAARHDRAGYHDYGLSLAVSPDGTAVFVTGESRAGSSANTADFVTVVYDAATGAQVSLAMYDGGSSDTAFDLAMSPDGQRLYVTGGAGGLNYGDYATVAYDWS